MSKHNYNVFFNTHTVSGIIISFALYVIFFAGAFALFKDEITIWEEGKEISHVERHNIDYDTLLGKLDDTYELHARDISFRLATESDKIGIFISGSKDTLASEEAQESHFFYANIHTGDTKTYSEQYSIGEFMYRLHFFAQLPTIGFYLAGIVALFFLFAIVTGVIVHWKKIISNFFAFNPKIALKRVWTEAHTALGLIGLPFQFVFAISGAFFCLSLFILLPANVLYENDREKLMADFRPGPSHHEWAEKTTDEALSFNAFALDMRNNWDEFELSRGAIENYGGTNMTYTIHGEFEDHKQFFGSGYRVINAFTGEIEEEKDPEVISYSEGVQTVLYRLHFADFGGVTMRVIYFVLALITCFVILSGVLIWIEARNRKNMTMRQRLYTAGVGRTYISICLSMLPVTALAFIFAKIAHGHFPEKQSTIYWFYFLVWLVAILIFRLKKDNYFTNKYSLLLGAIFGFLVPIVNGIVSGNWIWKTMANAQYEILFVDLLWISIALLSFLFYFKVKPTIKERSTYNKLPLKTTE